MKTSFLVACTLALTTTACFADSAKQSAPEAKKVSVFAKLFHKKAAAPVEAKKGGTHGDTDMQLSGTNFIIN